METHGDAQDELSSGSAARWCRPTLAQSLIGIALLVALVGVACRRALSSANADSLLYGLISTEQLTIFYWGQDRLANVVSALAWPVQDVMWNWALQTGMIAASFFLLIGCFVWFVADRSGRSRSWSVVMIGTFVTGAVCLVVLDRRAVYDLVLVQQYAFSTLLYLVGLRGLASGRTRLRIVGLVCVVAAALVIPSVVLLLPAAFVLPRGGAKAPQLVRCTAATVLAFVVTTVTSRLAYDGGSDRDAYADFSVERLWRGLSATLDDIAGSVRPLALAITVVIVTAAGVVVLVRPRPTTVPDRTLRWAVALAPVIAAGWVVVFTANRWVEMNGFRFRYFFPVYAAGIFLLASAVTTVTAWCHERVVGSERTSVRIALGSRAASAAAVSSAVALALVGVWGAVTTPVPWIDEGVRIADQAGDPAVEAELVIGDYWRVWPAMFADRARDGDLLAVANRSDPLLGRIRRVADDGPTVRVLCVGVDAAQCIGQMNELIGGSWRVTDVRSDTPLVLDAARA